MEFVKQKTCPWDNLLALLLLLHLGSNQAAMGKKRAATRPKRVVWRYALHICSSPVKVQMVSFPEHDFVATSAGTAGVAGGEATGVLLGVPVSAGAALLAAVVVGMEVAEASAMLVDEGLAVVDVGAAHGGTR